MWFVSLVSTRQHQHHVSESKSIHLNITQILPVHPNSVSDGEYAIHFTTDPSLKSTRLKLGMEDPMIFITQAVVSEAPLSPLLTSSRLGGVSPRRKERRSSQ